MRTGLLFFCAALGLLTAGPLAADTSALLEFDGQWRRVTAEENAERLAAIERALASLSWFTRTMAGPILRKTTVPPDRYVFEVEPDGIAFGARDDEPRPLMLDGIERPFESDRGPVTTSTRRRTDALETRWRTEQARGSNTFRVDGEGTLVVESVLQITAIDGVDPIAYETRFQRTPAVSSHSE